MNVIKLPMIAIEHIAARQIFDSRGYPTLEVDVHLSSRHMGRFSVPCGASRGKQEAMELRDANSLEFEGRGVQKAIHFIHTFIAPLLVGANPFAQEEIDRLLQEQDGTPNKSKLGANTLLGISMAVAKAAAEAQKKPFFAYLAKEKTPLLPLPFFNMLNGGLHANNGLDIQEFMIVPWGASSFSESLKMGAHVFYAIRAELKKRNDSLAVGDEGGFAPALKSHEEALDLLMLAIERAGFKPAQEVALALDAAASTFYHPQDNMYVMQKKNALSRDELIAYWHKTCQNYPIISLEDPLEEGDWEGWSVLTQRLGDKVQIVGDDLFVSHPHFIDQGIKTNAANAVLIKPNQIGTLTETLQAIDVAQKAKLGVMISHRSGETEDTSIADIAVGTAAGQIKAGSLSRSERLAKYNQLLRIEEQLGSQAYFFNMKKEKKYVF